ncbi:MAG: hypothetical protein M3541_02595, partial [Acidobacteriota bacterium]|nr:hypothetical protein [Acidobacteriota bacterium]
MARTTAADLKIAAATRAASAAASTARAAAPALSRRTAGSTLARGPNPCVSSPVTGSISPRPIASKRSPSMPRSMLAMLPLTASDSVGPSLENPGGR